MPRPPTPWNQVKPYKEVLISDLGPKTGTVIAAMREMINASGRELGWQINMMLECFRQLMDHCDAMEARLTVVEGFAPRNIKAVEKEAIINTLAYFGGHKAKAAAALGFTHKTFYNKLHAYGLADEYIKKEKSE